VYDVDPAEGIIARPGDIIDGNRSSLRIIGASREKAEGIE